MDRPMTRTFATLGSNASALIVASILWPIGCSSTPPSMAVICGAGWDGCSCYAEPSSTPRSAPAECDPVAYAGTTCCADPGWPSVTTTCACHTGDIYCGIVPAYFTDGTDGCVCAPYPTMAGEKPGATCYPGASTMTATLGICCMFPNGECACGAGLHTCGMGGAPVTTCSAANFPAPTHACASGKVLLASCSVDDAGAPLDSGTPPTDALPSGSCTSNTDCDPMFQFCQKPTCDATATGMCAVRPGQRQTYFCSPEDGGGPVCDCEGRTWDYACLANAEGINIASQGPCPMTDGGAASD
jgi:hypothetical protein